MLTQNAYKANKNPQDSFSVSEVLETFEAEIRNLTYKIFKCLSVLLGMGPAVCLLSHPSFLASYTEEDQVLRMLHYHAQGQLCCPFRCREKIKEARWPAEMMYDI